MLIFLIVNVIIKQWVKMNVNVKLDVVMIAISLKSGWEKKNLMNFIDCKVNECLSELNLENIFTIGKANIIQKKLNVKFVRAQLGILLM